MHKMQPVEDGGIRWSSPFPAFANLAGRVENSCFEKKGATANMPATGELIRMMNYVDDIAATVRRIQVGITSMTVEERKRLADYMRNSDPSIIKTLEALDKT
jgi:hypothetical protein